METSSIRLTDVGGMAGVKEQFANEGGVYDDLVAYLKARRLL